MAAVPSGRGSFRDQAVEAFSAVNAFVAEQRERMTLTSQTVFLRNPGDRAECEQLIRECYGTNQPVNHFVFQPPCSGAALAVEAWAIGGQSVLVERFGTQAVALTYDNVRWVYCGSIAPHPELSGVHAQTDDMLRRTQSVLRSARSDFQQAVRTWFYLGGITDPEGEHQRYYELNRARTDFYHDIRFCCSLLDPNAPRGVYPASTGIGMTGRELSMTCMTLQTKRDDVFLLPLENPQQTPAYAYHPKYSPKSPKFSRAMALILGDYVTTWISGTASIVDSESRHPGNVTKQTEQTIDNIERLIAPSNFALHGVKGAGAGLRDLAKLRVYVRRPEDYATCRAICERRFGPVPTIYAVADICRPELLVEIEGVAFSRYAKP